MVPSLPMEKAPSRKPKRTSAASGAPPAPKKRRYSHTRSKKELRLTLHIRGETHPNKTTWPPPSARKIEAPPTDAKPAETTSPTTSATFMERATLGPINITGLPLLKRPGSADDVRRLLSFRPSRYIWGGEQRRGILMHIDDAS